MQDSSSAREILLNRLADEFTARCRQGERPSLTEYVTRYPQLADEIRDLFPALIGIEQLKEACEDSEFPAGQMPLLEQLGDYRILREIGRGGMGIVYEAEQLSLGRRVALKVLPHRLRNVKHRQRFEREAQAAARLHHTNIVPVFSVGEENGLRYYAMQFIEGQGLDAVIEDRKRQSVRQNRGGERGGVSPPVLPRPGGSRLPARPAEANGKAISTLAETPGPAPVTKIIELAALGLVSAPEVHSTPLDDPSEQTWPGEWWRNVAQIGVQASGALEAAHQQGILHRDVKPSNLLLDSRGTVWVTDFGLAKVEGQENLTEAGDILGTLRYMPPEAFDGRSDPRSDVYSLGLTLYELLVLRPAFDARERSQLIKQVTAGEPPRLDRLNRTLPRDLVTIVHKALERDPNRRYGSAGDLAADLQRFLDDLPIQARRASTAEHLGRWARRHKGVVAALVVIAGLLIAAVVAAGVAAVGFRQLAGEREAARAEAVRAGDEERWQRYRADIAAAASALELNNLNVMRHAIDDAPEEHRGWEWRYLRGQLDSSRVVLRPSGPKGVLKYLTVSPTGKQFAAWDTSSQLLRRWDATTGAEAAPLGRHESQWGLLAWSPTGRQFAAAGDDRTVRLWDTVTGQPPAVLRGHLETLQTLSYSPDGKRIVSRDEHAYRLWDTATGQLLAVLGDNRRTSEARFSSDGQRFLIGLGTDVYLHDAVTGRQITVLGRHTAEVGYLAFSPDGHRIAASFADRVIRLWDGVTGKEVATLRGHTATVRGLVFSPDGARLASGSAYPDSTVRLWGANDGRLIALLAGHTNETRSIAFSPDGNRLVSASLDRTARLWDGDTGEPIAVLRGHNATLWGAVFSPDGKLILTWGDQTPRLWRGRSGEPVAVLRGHGADVVKAGFSDRGCVVVSESLDSTLRIWQTPRSEPGGILRGHTSFVYDLTFSPDGQRIASAAWDGTVRLWDAATGRQISLLKHQEQIVTGVTWSRDGRHLAAVTRDDRIHLWEADSRQRKYVLPGPTGDWTGDVRAAFNPADTLLAAGSRDGPIRLWDVANGTVAGVLSGHQGTSRDVAFHRDGTLLASAGHDQTVRLWDVTTQTQVAALRGHEGNVERVVFSADGRLLASGSADRTVRLWDTRTHQEVAVLSCGSHVSGLAFSPDGTRLAVGCSDNTVRLFALATHEQVAELRGPADYVRAVAFSPDGRRLAFAAGDHVIRLWDTLPPRGKNSEKVCVTCPEGFGVRR